MKLTEKLIGYLNRVFDKGPAEQLALRLNYDGTSMRWTVSDAVLTTTVTGGSGVALSVDLSAYTVAGLATFLAAQPGYSVPYVSADLSGRSARVLLDGTGDPAQSNGDHLNAYTSVLWAYLDSLAGELHLARLAVSESLQEMSARTANGDWVDEHGTYYAVTRNSGETDASYAARMIAEVGQARGNGVAMAASIKNATGAFETGVVDYATITTAGDGTKSYGLFDVTVSVDADAPLNQEQIDANTRAIIEAMRDAGTHLRTLRYLRRVSMPLYAGAVVLSGHVVTVQCDGIGTLILDGSWTLDGTYILNGVKDH